MDQPLCKLTLIYPRAVAESVVELMLGLKPAIGGFTTFAGHGHGLDFATASIGELVRGHVERGVLMAVMPKSRASEVLETIRQKLPIPHMAYWLEPVLDLGRLTSGIPA